MSSARSESGLGRRWFRTFGFRLNAWYTVVLTSGLVATYLTVAFLASYAVEQADRQIIVAKLEEYRARFEDPSFRDPASVIPPSALRIEDEPYLVRVSNAQNRAVFTHIPEKGLVFEEASLEVVVGDDRHTWTRIRSANDHRMWTIGSVRLSSGRRLQIGMSSRHSEAVVHRLRQSALVAFVPLLLLGLVGSAYLTRRALLPIRDLSHAMRAIEASGDLTARVPERATGDELDELSELFNRMTARQEHLVNAMRDALDNVAHDLRTPMTRLRGSAELALRTNDTHKDPHELREALADCLEEADRVNAMLTTLMDISEAESGVMLLERTSFDLGELGREVLDLYEYVAVERRIEVTSELEADVVVLGDRIRLFRATANLVDNALKYTPSGRTVHLAVRQTDGRAELEVSDEGPGIQPADFPRIWERLYRGDKSRSQRGLGLGLTFVRAIVAAHGGEVRVTSEPGQGATFTMQVPAS